MDRRMTLAVGGTEVTPVWDGTLEAKAETILGLDPGVARDLIATAAAATGADPLVLPVRAFLIRAGGRLVLVDTGSGTTKGPSMGQLPASLAAMGVAPGDIAAVLMTHMHLDHAGGLIDEAGRRAFPEAELILHEAEARFCLDTPPDKLDARSRRHVELQRRAVAAYGRNVRRVADGPVLPGIAAELAPGHTPGHTSFIVGTPEQHAIVLGDIVHLAAVQLARPDTAMIYDVDPQLAARTRHAVLARAAAARALVLGAHLPAPGMGFIARDGAGYRFDPAG